MELQIYKPLNFMTMEDSELIAIIDKFQSVIWTERYNGYGDFELYIPIYDRQMVNMIKNNDSSFNILNYFIDLKGNESTMIVESINIKTDVDGGDYFIISGRSLESILDRRYIVTKTTVNGNLNDCIKTLINKHAIITSNPDSLRKLTGLEYEDSTDDYILGINLKAQFTGYNLHETIQEICNVYGLGFEIKRKYYKTKNLSDFNTFVFRLKNGKNRSYDQTENPYVVFSSEYGNIFNSDYKYSIKNHRTRAFIAGEDHGTSRRTTTVNISNYPDNKNWRMRELYVDARDLQSEKEDGTTMSDDDYITSLKERGKEKLSENNVTDEIEGEFDPNGNFKLDEDYFLGDIVQVEYPITGISKKARISETILNESSEGSKYIPTIDVME